MALLLYALVWSAAVAVASAVKTMDMKESKALFSALLQREGQPNVLTMSKALQETATQYSRTGFLAQVISSDAMCRAPAMSSGASVNVCNVMKGFSYKIQLVKDSCVGGVIEYYYDKTCANLAGTSPLEDILGPPCTAIGPGLYLTFVCTTRDKPPVDADSLVTMEYRGHHCDVPDMYVAMPANLCQAAPNVDFNDSMLTCSDGKAAYVEYTSGSGCQGKALSTDPYPSQCFALTYGSDDDDGGASTASSGRRPVEERVSDAVLERVRAILRQMIPYYRNHHHHRGYARDQTGREPRDLKKRGRITQARVAHASLATHPAAAAAVDGHIGPSVTLATDLGDDDVSYTDDAGDDHYYAYDDYYYYDDYYSSSGDDWLAPPPSVSTTPFPTTAAEAEPKLSVHMTCQAAPPRRAVAFSVKQMFSGVSLGDYLADQVNCERSLKEAIASSIVGTDVDSISKLTVTEAVVTPAASLRVALTAPVRLAARLLSSNAIAATYTVTVSDTTYSADFLVGQLQTAITTGAFTTALRSYATTNNATALTAATADSVTVVSSSEGSDSNPSKLTDGEIAGIVIGGAFGLFSFIVAVCAFRVLVQHQLSVYPSSDAAQAQQDGLDTAPAVAASVPSASAPPIPPQEPISVVATPIPVPAPLESTV